MPNLTGMATGVTPRFVQFADRIYMANGRNRMRKYDGENWRLAGITAGTTSAVTLATNSTGMSGTYYYMIAPANTAHRVPYSNRAVTGLPSPLSSPLSVNNQGIRVSGIPSTHEDAQVDYWYVFRNKNGFLDTNLEDGVQDFYYVGKVAVGTTTYDDTTIDDSLEVEQIDFRTNIPPTCKYIESYANRLMGCGFDEITDGTATVNGGDDTLIDFSTAKADGVLGCYFQKQGDDQIYTITSVESTTQVGLDRSFAGTLSSASYRIWRDSSVVWYSEFLNFDAWGANGEDSRNQIHVGVPGTNEVVTGIKAMGDYCYVFTKTKIFRIFAPPGEVDASAVTISPAPIVDGTGCISHDSIVRVNDRLYFMSLRGPMEFDGVSARNIGDKLGYEWLDELAPDQLALCAGGYSPRTDTVKFSVPQTGETENSLTWSWHRPTQTWWKEEYAHPTFYAQDLDENGEPALFYAQGAFIVQDDRGTSDGLPGGTKAGTATSGATTSLTDSAASFYTTGDGLTERYIHIYDSTGALKGRRRITSNTGTQVSWADALSTAAASGDTYHIAPVLWYWKTKTFMRPGHQQKSRSLHVNFDLRGESTVSKLYKTDYYDDTASTGTGDVTVNEVHKKFEVQQGGHEYAAKVEVRATDNDVVIRDLKLDIDHGADHK